MAIRNVTPQAGDWTTPQADDRYTTVKTREDTLEKEAKRLGADLKDLLAANPQITDPDHMTPGTAIRVPRNLAGPPATSAAPDDVTVASDSAASRYAEARLEATAMRSKLEAGGSAGISAAGAAAAPAATAPAPAAAETQSYLSTDPRFADVNAALNASDGEAAMGAASKLIAELQKEKPPNQQLLNEARMGLAAGAMVAGKLNDAQKVLLAIPPKSLGAVDKAEFNDLRDLLKSARLDLFTSSFKADMGRDSKVKDRGQAAADQARELLELLQKTEPGNTEEIDEVRMKLANALLVGGHYRDAEMALTGVNEKPLPSELKNYLQDIRQEIHVQQIVSLGNAYDADIKKGNYKEAVSNATALVNDLAKYFPGAKDHIMAARVELASAQMMAGDVEGARKSLAHVTREEFQAAPKELQQLYHERNSQIDKYMEAEKKLKSDEASIQHELQSIESLLRSGNKDLAKDAAAQAERLLETVKQKYPDNTEAISRMELTVANVELAAGQNDVAIDRLQKLASTSSDPEVKDQAKLFEAQAWLQKGQVSKGVQMMRSLSETASTPEIQKAAKSGVISVESDYLKAVDKKTDLERDQLDRIKAGKTAKDDSWYRAFNPFNINRPSVAEEHEMNLNRLFALGNGAIDLQRVMKNLNLTVSDIQKMDFKELSKTVGSEKLAREFQVALANPDVQLIAKDDFNSGKFSWETNKLYVDPSYLESAIEVDGRLLGQALRGVHSGLDKAAHSGIPLLSEIGALGEASMDALSATNRLVKSTFQHAWNFYNEADAKGKWYGGVGRGITWGAEQVASVFTMPATVLDYKADDRERGDAIVGTLAMVGTAGLLEAGGPVLARGLGAVGSRVATSGLGRWVADSWLGRVATNVGGKIGGVLRTEIKLGGSKEVETGGLAVHSRMSNVMYDSSIKGFDMDKLLKELETTDAGSRIADGVRRGEIHVTVTREPLVGDATVEGMSYGKEMNVVWQGSVEETASTALHEGVHNLDPTTTPGGKDVSETSREALAREAEYEYRIKRNLPVKDTDPFEKVYRSTLDAGKKSGLSDAEARLQAEQALVNELSKDPFYGKNTAGTVGQARRVGPVAAEDAERIRQITEWQNRGKIRGDVEGLKKGLREGTAEARAEFEEARTQIIENGQFHHVEDFADNPASPAPVRTARMSDANKRELENSAWLGERFPDPDVRREFMQWLEDNHQGEHFGDHLNPYAGSPQSEVEVQNFSKETGRRINDPKQTQFATSDWLKDRLPSAADRERFMDWLNNQFRSEHTGEPLSAGSPQAEAKLQEWRESQKPAGKP